MKKNRILVILLALAMAAAMLMTACNSSSEPDTLESYIEKDADLKAEVDETFASASEQGVEVEISGNDIIYTFDLSNMDGVDEDYVKSDEAKALLESGLAGQEDTFTEVASLMKEEAGIEGIQVIVRYVWGDEEILSQTFVPASE